MNRLISTLLLFAFTASPLFTNAEKGDTIVVQTFTFDTKGSPKKGKFKFPSRSKNFRKIYAYYTLRCVPGNNPSCGEWDRSTYLRVYDKNNTRYELGRYITPYGIGLDLGDKGFRWVYDVTDYEPLLHDSVYIEAGNEQEQLDLKFIFIEGTPVREVLDIKNLWTGRADYDTGIEEDFLTPLEVIPNSKAKGYKLKMRTTGHGFGGNENCAEFCKKEHYFKVDRVKRFSDSVWKDDCSMNPLYPQGGTWLFSRAGWCPGDIVQTYNYELTPYFTPGEKAILDYNVQPYTYQGGGSKPRYIIETQLISYGPVNAGTDATLDEIIAPNKWEFHQRYNPICDGPVIRIKNAGSKTLKKLDIEYGVKGGKKHRYHWTGNLEFTKTETIHLPAKAWGTWNGKDIYEVTLENPNGQKDEYPEDNAHYAPFQRPDVHQQKLIFYFRTNVAGEETTYKLYDAFDNVIYSRDDPGATTYYKDTFNLAPGCYELVINDSDDDGLDFWFNEDGKGILLLLKTGSPPFPVKSLEEDFGRQIRYSFMTGYGLSKEDPEIFPEFKVYPNPVQNTINFNSLRFWGQDLQVSAFTLMGQKVLERSFDKVHSKTLTINLRGLKSGLYLLRFHSRGTVITRKVRLR